MMDVLWGYNGYKNHWDLSLKDEFGTKHQHCNTQKYVVAIVPVDSKTEDTIGNLARKISKQCCWFQLP